MLELLRRLFLLPAGASSFADGVDALHFSIIGTTLVGATALALAVTFFLTRYRQRVPGAATPRLVVTRGGEALMIGGTLSLFLLWWVIGYRQYVQMRRTPPGARDTVYVMAKQWMWKFSYPSGESSLGVLTLPLGRKVQLIMTSRDVIHSFFVPAFRVKQDVLPGRYVTLWFEPTLPGEYPIECAEYCGVSHSHMLGRVRVLTAPAYATWLEAGGRSPAGGAKLAEAGRAAAVKHACLACHTVDGRAHIGPSWRGLFGSSVELTNGQHVTADAEYLTRAMMDPAAEIVAGYRAVMPTYLGSLSQPEVAAILEYIRSLPSVAPVPSVSLPRVQVLDSSAPPAAEPQ